MWGALVAFGIAGGTAAWTAYWPGHARSGAGADVSPSASVLAGGQASEQAGAKASEEAPVEPLRPLRKQDRLLASAMSSVKMADGTEVAVSVLDLESGGSASYGEGPFSTASIVKVDILATLLLQAQDAGRRLTPQEREYATAMIEKSDNESTSALWEVIGRADGLGAANERLGLTGTEGGQGPVWGMTQTTPADQIALLRQVFRADGSRLSEASRAYVQGLMQGIVQGQRWGVSAAADGSAWALKNGWLRRSTTRLWVVNSIGRVTSDGHDRLVAVLSQGSTTMEDGISLTESAAKAAVSVFAAGGPAGDQNAS